MGFIYCAKFADGTPIENFEDAIIMENGSELKAWDAIARYMQSLPDTDGMASPIFRLLIVSWRDERR